jgi:cytoskeletal protein CcmA (bactofilin family)
VIGNVCGEPELPTILVISETASITGEIQADHIIINGVVNGPVHARLLLELQPKAKIHGDVSYTALEMHQGAIIAGQLRPLIEGEEKPTLKLAANNA